MHQANSKVQFDGELEICSYIQLKSKTETFFKKRIRDYAVYKHLKGGIATISMCCVWFIREYRQNNEHRKQVSVTLHITAFKLEIKLLLLLQMNRLRAQFFAQLEVDSLS